MRKLILWAVLVVFAVGCKKTHHTSPSHELFPDEIGDTWTYIVNDTSYMLLDPPTISTYQMTVSVVGDIQLPNGTMAKVWVYSTPAGNDTNYVARHGDTIIYFPPKYGIGIYGREYIIPLTVNQSWGYSWMSVYPVTISSQATITVNQNQFENAFHITGNPGRPDEIIGLDEWVADYVGVVKRYVNASGTTNPFKHRTSWSLVSYHLQ